MIEKKTEMTMHKIVGDHEWKHYRAVQSFESIRICKICNLIEDVKEDFSSMIFGGGGAGGHMITASGAFSTVVASGGGGVNGSS